MADGSGSGSSEAIVASQSIVSTWLIPIMWRAGTFIGGLFFLAVGALYYKQVSRPLLVVQLPLHTYMYITLALRCKMQASLSATRVMLDLSSVPGMLVTLRLKASRE